MPTDLTIGQAAGAAWRCVVGTLLAAGVAVAAGEQTYQAAEGLTVVHPVMHQNHLRNPGMGLIYYGTPEDPPDCADVLYFHMAWYDVEKAPGEFNFNTPRFQQALRVAEKHDRKLAIRLVTSWQNYETPIPRYLLDRGVRLFPHGQQHGSRYEHFYEPEWWHPAYIAAHKRMVKAWGAFIDGHPRVAWIDARYYGFWGEGHRYQAVEPWPDDVDLQQYCKDRIDEYIAAFKQTPIVVQTAGDNDVPYPHGTAIDYAVDRGMWMRRDGFGCCIEQDESDFIKANFPRSIVIAENAGRLTDFYAGDRIKHYFRNRLSNLDSLVDEMFEHRINYFPLGWGKEGYELLAGRRPDIITRASLRTGYRFVVTRGAWPPTVSPGDAFALKADWVNLAVGRLPFRYWPTVWLKGPDGAIVGSARVSNVDVTGWVEGARYATEFDIKLPSSVAPGTYSLWVGLADEKEHPVVALGIEGDDGQRRYRLGTVEVK